VLATLLNSRVPPLTLTVSGERVGIVVGRVLAAAVISNCAVPVPVTVNPPRPIPLAMVNLRVLSSAIARPA